MKYMQVKSKVMGNFMLTKRFPALRPISEAFHQRLRSLKAPDIVINDEQMQLLCELYAAGNKALSERFAVDLESRGYLT